MFQEQQNSIKDDLEHFSKFLGSIRTFMDQHQIIEVVTNPLMEKIIPDRGVDPVKVDFHVGNRFLHTSPEWEMKKLLVQGSGSIYQMASVFRDDVEAKWHKPSFIMLEWYEVGIDENQLIQRCVDLVKHVGVMYQPQIVSMFDLYAEHCSIDLKTTSIDLLMTYCQKESISYADLQDDDHLSSWLELIWVNRIECELQGFVIIKDFPVCQAALAKVEMDPFPHARRFEIFIDGCEIANGYCEATNTNALEERFSEYKGPHSVVDTKDINGLPECAGVSIGVERLFAIKRRRQFI